MLNGKPVYGVILLYNHVYLLLFYLLLTSIYRPFYKPLPRSIAFVAWISVWRFYETDCMYNKHTYMYLYGWSISNLADQTNLQLFTPSFMLVKCYYKLHVMIHLFSLSFIFLLISKMYLSSENIYNHLLWLHYVPYF